MSGSSDLPSAKVVLKRARQQQVDADDKDTVAYKAVCSYLSERTPIQLAQGVVITSTFVSAQDNVAWPDR